MTQNEQDLIEQIRRAFAGVRLEDGISLNMTEYIDAGGCVPEFREKARNDEREDWAAIADETLEQFSVTFPFTDLKGIKFYIPAYMNWSIRNHRTSWSGIADFTIYAIDPLSHHFDSIPFRSWFNSAQVEAMAAFLEYAVANDETMDGQAAAKNLARIADPLREPPTAIRF